RGGCVSRRRLDTNPECFLGNAPLQFSETFRPQSGLHGETNSQMNTPKNQALLLILFAAFALNASAAEKATSEWVHPGKNGKLVYKTSPAGDRIMDFSTAGYMGGGVALPDVPVKKTVQPSGSA